MGVFHCGIEVLGVEFSFQAMADCSENDETSGLTWHNPKMHPRHVYRESVCLGKTTLRVTEIGKLLERLEKAWPARNYNCLSNNCVDFAEQFAKALGAPEPFPNWVHGLAKQLAGNKTVWDFGMWLMPCCRSASESCKSQSSSSVKTALKAVATDDHDLKVGSRQGPVSCKLCFLQC